MYLHRDDLLSIIEFIDKFDVDVVDIEVDSSSGIGSIVTATINNVSINGTEVSVSKEISGVENW